MAGLLTRPSVRFQPRPRLRECVEAVLTAITFVPFSLQRGNHLVEARAIGQMP